MVVKHTLSLSSLQSSRRRYKSENKSDVELQPAVSIHFTTTPKRCRLSDHVRDVTRSLTHRHDDAIKLFIVVVKWPSQSLQKTALRTGPVTSVCPSVSLFVPWVCLCCCRHGEIKFECVTVCRQVNCLGTYPTTYRVQLSLPSLRGTLIEYRTSLSGLG